MCPPSLLWAIDRLDGAVEQATVISGQAHNVVDVIIEFRAALRAVDPQRCPEVAAEFLCELFDGSATALNLMDYGLQLGRRFRALKLWWVLRAFGIEGVRDRIREHVRLAEEFARWVDREPQLERLAAAPLSVVCFRARPDGLDVAELDAFNLRLLELVNRSGEVFLSHTRLDPGIALRVAIGNLGTTAADVERCQQLLTEALAELASRTGSSAKP